MMRLSRHERDAELKGTRNDQAEQRVEGWYGMSARGELPPTQRITIEESRVTIGPAVITGSWVTVTIRDLRGVEDSRLSVGHIYIDAWSPERIETWKAMAADALARNVPLPPRIDLLFTYSGNGDGRVAPQLTYGWLATANLFALEALHRPVDPRLSALLEGINFAETNVSLSYLHIAKPCVEQ